MGIPGFTLFNTIQKPNDIFNGCRFDTRNNILSDNSFTIGASSAHPGGVNVLMGDGSARFIKDSIALNIWWSLGTRAGGEVIERPTRTDPPCDCRPGPAQPRPAFRSPAASGRVTAPSAPLRANPGSGRGRPAGIRRLRPPPRRDRRRRQRSDAHRHRQAGDQPHPTVLRQRVGRVRVRDRRRHDHLIRPRPDHPTDEPADHALGYLRPAPQSSPSTIPPPRPTPIQTAACQSIWMTISVLAGSSPR